MKVEATKRVIATATRVVSNDDGDGDGGKSNGNGDEGAGQATTRAMVVATRGRDKFLGIDCTQIPINWSCHRGIYLELQFLRIAT